MSVNWNFYDLPVGRALIAENGRGITHILWNAQGMDGRQHTSDLILRAQWELSEYFSGARREFTVPLDMSGTPFMARVWQALRAIPYGQTRTYGQIAKDIGAENAYRAVGMACGRNPVSIIVPCHRAVGAGGKLTGYAGGLDAKRALLTLEGVLQ